MSERNSDRPLKDAYVRLDEAALAALAWCHLHSELDPVHDARDGPDAFTGCTEWATAHAPRASIGWDWRISAAIPVPLLVEHSIRTNVMLVDGASGEDLGWSRTVAAMRGCIGRLPWQEAVLACLRARAP